MNNTKSRAIQITATISQVLQPRFIEPIHHVSPLAIQGGTPQAAVVARAAAQVQALYADGVRSTSGKNREAFYDECADTCMTAFDTQSVLDDATSAIVAAIFKAAGWFSGTLKPITLRAQVEIQMYVIEAARSIRLLLAKQQTLALI